MRLSRLLLSICLSALLVACASTGSSRYSCGVPEGQPCRSALDVYADTDASVAPDQSWHRNDPAPTTDDHWQVDQRADGELVLVAEAPPRLPTMHAPMPVRTEARILRIWIAPFENADGDLVAGAHLYTEIEPRRWRYGQAALPEQPSLSLLSEPASSSVPTSKPSTVNTD